MKMKFRCKKCGKFIFLHEKTTQSVVEFMVSRQNMYKSLWNKDFDGKREVSLLGIVESCARCCTIPEIEMLSFIGFENISMEELYKIREDEKEREYQKELFERDLDW